MLRIHDVALELVRDVVPLLREIERSDPDLARQGRRAVMSVPLNISEASDQVGKRRAHHYRIALGSARETLGVVRAAQAAQYIGGTSAALEGTFNQVIGTLHRCIYPA